MWVVVTISNHLTANPDRHSIVKWAEMFILAGLVVDAARLGSSKAVMIPENVEVVRKSLLESRQRFMRKHVQVPGLSAHTVRRIWYLSFKCHP